MSIKANSMPPLSSFSNVLGYSSLFSVSDKPLNSFVTFPSYR